MENDKVYVMCVHVNTNPEMLKYVNPYMTWSTGVFSDLETAHKYREIILKSEARDYIRLKLEDNNDPFTDTEMEDLLAQAREAARHTGCGTYRFGDDFMYCTYDAFYVNEHFIEAEPQWRESK